MIKVERDYNSGSRNLLINGDFGVWQRGVTFPGGSFVYTADRWTTLFPTSKSGNKAVVIVDDPTKGFVQGIELENVGNDSRFAIGTKLAVSFDASCASGTPTLHALLIFRNESNGGVIQVICSNTIDFTLSTAEDKHVGVFEIMAAPLSTNICLDLVFYGDINTYTFGNIQLEIGEVATPFDHRPAGLELALCQRYFCKSYAQENAPGMVLDGGYVLHNVSSTWIAGHERSGETFPVDMRVVPTVHLYSANTGTIDKWDKSGTNDINMIPTGVSSVRFKLKNDTGADLGLPAAHVYGHYTADAEL